MNILHVDASIMGTHSVSREVSAAIVAQLRKASPQAQVTYRDLASEDLPHMTIASLPTDHPLAAKAGPLSAAAQRVRDSSQRMLEEFLAADTIVIGVPMYNFSVPSQLKAWIDRILVPNKTFSYATGAPVGLATGKRVVVALVRGGFYGPQTAAVGAEHAETYIRTVLGFIGIANPEIILVEGVNAGEETKSKAVAAAHDAVKRLAA